MSDEDKLKQVIALTGASGEDDVLTAYLAAAKGLILNVRNPFSDDPESEDWETRFDSLQCEIAADMYFRRGAEGETTHDENGVKRTWASAGVSTHLTQRITPRGKVLSK